MPDGLLREIIVRTDACYFTVLAFALLLALVRCLGFELARRFKHRKILQLLNSPLVFFLAVFIVSAAYMVPSVHGATTLRTVAYDIALDKNCETDTFSIAVISGFHVGAGARHSEMGQMVERVAAAKPELILIAGEADVALCGHTHGYQFPFFGVLVPYSARW